MNLDGFKKLLVKFPSALEVFRRKPYPHSHCPVARHGASRCLDTFRHTGLICRLTSKVGHRSSKKCDISTKIGHGSSKNCAISSKIGHGSSKNRDISSKTGRRSSKKYDTSLKNRDVSLKLGSVPIWPERELSQLAAAGQTLSRGIFSHGFDYRAADGLD